MLARPRMALPIVAILAALAAGCSRSEPPSTPAACLGGPDSYLEALGGARRGQVALADGTPISGCLVPAQGGGELAEVGAAMVTAATRLNAEARRDGGEEAAFELGYLVGAAQRGAEDTSGIHTDLIRRLNSAASFSESGSQSPSFGRSFARGYADGRANG